MWSCKNYFLNAAARSPGFPSPVDNDEDIKQWLKTISIRVCFFTMKFLKHLRTDWFKYGFETMAVIVGILAAFALDNWNSEQLTTQNSSYLDLTNSGSLSIIGNQDLKESIINYYRQNEQVAAHILEFNEVSSRHLVEVGNVIPNYGKLHHISDDLYQDKSMYREDEWAFINDPTSFKFQTLEYALHAYRIKHMEFLAHFRMLKELSAALIESIQEELELRHTK